MSNVAAEALAKRIDWTQGRSFADWKCMVGPKVRAVWHTFSDEQKIAVASDAFERARDADESSFEKQRNA